MSKYGNRKTTVCGITFDSKKEAERFLVLKDMERRGEIDRLMLQVPFELIPAQRNAKGRVIEKAVTYVADFTYIRDGAYVVEDTKGFRTDVYRIKKKLMLWRYGVQVREV